jgi:hypothetical protein
MKEQTENETSVLSCEVCPRNLDCSNLFMALELLQHSAEETGSAEAQFRYEDFKRRLSHLKFRYPSGNSSCLLTNNAELARALVQESIELIQTMKSSTAS